MSTAFEVAADWERLRVNAVGRIRRTVTVHGALLQADVKRRAREPRTNPRPSLVPEGPRLMTGDYNRSITRQTRHLAASSTAAVGTNKVQGPRLEMGYVGTDSLGRSFSQRAYPHFGPALDDREVPFVQAIGIAGLAHPGD